MHEKLRLALHLDDRAHLVVGKRFQVEDREGALVFEAADARRSARDDEPEATEHERLKHKVLDQLLKPGGLIDAVDDDNQAA